MSGRAAEFALIDRIRRRAGKRSDVILGIGDDAALLRVPEGHELVLSTDTLIAGVHFPIGTSAEDIGWKALAVNLSDLAAMGAEPTWMSLALTLPEADEAWLDGFLDGFCELADQHRVALVGGDTTRGPLSITIAAHVVVPAGLALRRDRACVNDDVWVTGTLGDAAGALNQWRRQGLQSAKLRYRLDRPTPRVSAGIALRGLANAAIDLSDGLVADLGHVLDRSSRDVEADSDRAPISLGAQIDLARLPTSRTLAEHFAQDDQRWGLQLAVGDDYELCFTAAPVQALAIEKAMAACATAATVIGRITREPGLQLLTPEGENFEIQNSGYHHFAGALH